MGPACCACSVQNYAMMESADVGAAMEVSVLKKKKKSVRVVGFREDDARPVVTMIAIPSSAQSQRGPEPSPPYGMTRKEVFKDRIELSLTFEDSHFVPVQSDVPLPAITGGNSNSSNSNSSSSSNTNNNISNNSNITTTTTTTTSKNNNNKNDNNNNNTSSNDGAAVYVADVPEPRFEKQQAAAKAVSAFSAAQFRRLERAHRQLGICCDVMKGDEDFKKPLQALGWVILAWLGLPIVAITLTFGLIPYSETGGAALRETVPYWRSLWPWIVIMAVLACLMTDIFSFVAYEIEYGIVIAEELPMLYVKAVVSGISGALVIQSIIFGSYSLALSASHGWLAVVTAGFLCIVGVLYHALARHGPVTDDIRSVLRKSFAGMFVTMPCAAVVYTVVAAVYSEYHLAGGGVVGYLIAILYPLLRHALQGAVESRWGLQWGGERGMLCAGPVAAILLESWHVVYLCLIAGTSATPIELAVMAAVQALITYSDLRQPGAVCCSMGACCVQDSKIDVYHFAIGDSESGNPDARQDTTKGSMNTKKRPPPSCIGQCLLALCGGEMRRGGSNSSTLSIANSNPNPNPNPTLSIATGNSSLGNVRDGDNNICAKLPFPFEGDLTPDTQSPSLSDGRDTPSPPPNDGNTWDEDVDEVRRICRTMLASSLGVLAPCCTLIVAAILDAGPNRHLFRGAGYLWSLSSLEASSDSSADWLGTAGPGGANGQANAFVGNLLCVGAFHLACLACAAHTFAVTNKRNLVGTFSTLILTHHLTSFCCAASLSFLVVVSVVFAPYGMNSEF